MKSKQMMLLVLVATVAYILGMMYPISMPDDTVEEFGGVETMFGGFGKKGGRQARLGKRRMRFGGRN